MRGPPLVPNLVVIADFPLENRHGIDSVPPPSHTAVGIPLNAFFFKLREDRTADRPQTPPPGK